MPFVKKTIHLSSVNLQNKVVKSNLHLVINQHQQIINAAQNTANNLIAQAKIKANRLLKETELKIQSRQQHTQKSLQGLIDQTKKQAQVIQQNIAEKTKQDVLKEVDHLIQALNQSKEQFFHENEDFFKSILNEMISSLAQEIDLKSRLEILAQKVINQAKGLEEGVLYFNSKDLDSNPHIVLPLNWKILADNDVPPQTCKLVAQGSEWYISFKHIETDITSFFKPAIQFESDTVIDEEGYNNSNNSFNI